MDTVKRKALVVHLGLESAAVLPRITGAWNAAALPGVHLEHLIIGRSSITKAHAPAGEGLRTEEILYAAKGAGAAQKAAFSYAQSGSFDVVITVRTPELAPKDLERMLACFDGPGCDAVIAVSAGSARLSDRFLTALQNALLKRNIADFYSDARAFSVKILSAIPFDYNSNGDEFDVQVLIQLTDISARLAQIGAAGKSHFFGLLTYFFTKFLPVLLIGCLLSPLMENTLHITE